MNLRKIYFLGLCLYYYAYLIKNVYEKKRKKHLIKFIVFLDFSVVFYLILSYHYCNDGKGISLYYRGLDLVIGGHKSSFSFCYWWIPTPIYSMPCFRYALKKFIPSLVVSSFSNGYFFFCSC